MEISRKSDGQLLWEIFRREFRYCLRVGGILFAVFATIFALSGFSSQQTILMAALFLIGSFGVVGIDLAQEFKRSTGYPSFREVSWPVYALTMTWSAATFALLQLILQTLKESHDYQSVAFASIAGLILGAFFTAIPAKRS